MMNSQTTPVSPRRSITPIVSAPSNNTSTTREVEKGEIHRAQRLTPMEGMHGIQLGGNPRSQRAFPSLLERCKNHIKQNIRLHLFNLIDGVLDTSKDIGTIVENNDWMAVKKFLAPIDSQTEIDYIPIEDWIEKIFRNTLTDIFSTWSEEKRKNLEERLNIFLSCLDEGKISTASSLFSLLHEGLKRNIWVKPTSEFTPIPGERPGGSAPEMQFFQDSARNQWLGKCGSLALYDRRLLLEQNEDKADFISPYADEILEKLGLAIYELVGVNVPESALSYQWVTEEARLEYGCDSPRMHYLSKWIDNFQTLGSNFVADYVSQAKRCGNDYVKVTTKDGEELPLIGLGRMLAAADFLYDLDCIGNQGGNVGYTIQTDPITSQRYAQVVKIDAGYALSYYEARYDQEHDPRKRNIRIRPDEGMLDFASLAPIDQREFANASRRILSIPREEFAHLFAHAEHTDEGIPKRHAEAILNGLIARKNLFLKAFAPETDRTIVEEIETAQAKIAKKIESSEEVDSETVEHLFAQEKEEAKALAALRTSLAVAEVRGSEPKTSGECKTFQLPSATTHFVGRTEAIASIVKQLNQTRGSVIGQSISGIGGAGKTQLALHLAHAAAKGEQLAGKHLSYDYVIWLNAETFLEGQFQAMAEVWLGRNDFKADEASQAVYAFFGSKRSLIIFDNVESARSIQAFLPPPHYASTMHLLITSRSSQWGDIATVKLDGFSLEEAQDYVQYHLGPQSKEAVVKLTELLDGLPLAISQAVSYIKAGHCTLEAFEQQFYLNQANLLSHELILEESHPKTVGTTLTLALAQAKMQSAIAEKLLGVTAYLSAQEIQIELLVSAMEAPAEEVLKAIEGLENYSLLSRKGKSVQVHRMVQEVMRHRHKFLLEPHCYWDTAVWLLDQVVTDDYTDIKGLKLCSNAVAHVQQMANLSKLRKLNEKQDLSVAGLLETTGNHQQIMGNYRIARDCLEHALTIVVRCSEKSNAKVAAILGNLSNAYGALGNAYKKKELLERALAIFEECSDSEHPDVARVLLNLGNAYGMLGDNHKKRELLERSLTINKGFYDKDHPEIAKTLVSLGNTYGALGNVQKQKELLERALIIEEQCYDKDHPDLAITLVNLGNAYGMLGNMRKKAELLKRALDIIEPIYGRDHPKVAEVLISLSSLGEILGDIQKQKKLIKRALKINKHHFGKNHPEVARASINLSIVYGYMGKFEKQKKYAERALKIKIEYYGIDHPEVAFALESLGNAHGALGDIGKQRELLEQALNIQENYYNLEHPLMANTLVNLSNVYGTLGDAFKQKELLERALTIDEMHSDSSNMVAMTLGNLAYACSKLGQQLEAKDYAQRAYAIFEEYYGENHPNTQRAKELLQECEKLAQGEESKEKEDPAEKA